MSFNTLFSPITINRMEMENRIVLAPIGPFGLAKDGFVTPAYRNYFLGRARGGAGMITLGSLDVQPLAAGAGIGDDKFVPGLREMVAEIHSETGAKVCAQFIDARQETAEDKFRINDVKQLIDDFSRSSIRALEADFDAIELHGAHSFILAAFMSLANEREDEYGRSIEGRMKLTEGVYKGVREAVGRGYPIGIRINADEFISGGNTLAQSRSIATRLAEIGIDYISISVGGKTQDSHGILPGIGLIWAYPPIGGYSGLRCIPPAYMPEAVNVYLAADIRNTLRNAGYLIPVMTAGKIPHPKLAETILQEGQADLIGLCRPLMRDPEWPVKAKKGRDDEINRCTYCNACMETVMKGDGPHCKYSENSAGSTRATSTEAYASAKD